jgi:site-specific DNA recombinase
MTMAGVPRRVATYARVSTEDQAERGTIANQRDQLERWLARQDDEVVVVGRYEDDGVSGTIPLAERPSGGRLMRDAASGAFDQLVVFKFDRLGRDEIDLLVVRRRFKELGIRLISTVEGEPNDLGYGVQALVSADARRQLLIASTVGIERAAREGRWLGGQPPYGYRTRLDGRAIYLEPDNQPVVAAMTAADVVRHIYRRIGLDGWSCRAVADELNDLQVPTAYVRRGRLIGEKDGPKVMPSGRWRDGRIRNLVVSSVYRGEQRFGVRIDQRSAHTEKRGHEIISAGCAALVEPELWQAAQETLARNRIAAKNTERVFLLRGLLRCSLCGHTFIGSMHKGSVWYRCSGRQHRLGPERCLARMVKGTDVETWVWQDIERFLRHPGDVLDELDCVRERDEEAQRCERERLTLQAVLANLVEERRRLIGFAAKGILTETDLQQELARLARERQGVESRLTALAPLEEAGLLPSPDLLAEIRGRLDRGFSDTDRQHIARLLVAGIEVRSDVAPDGSRTGQLVASYRFPRGALSTRRDTGSWPRSTGIEPGSATARGPETGRRCPLRVAGAARRARPGRTRRAHPKRGFRDERASPRRAAAQVRRRPSRRRSRCDEAT